MQTLAARRESSALRTIRWGPHQDAYLRCLAREKLLRVGNQCGKTVVALAEIILLALGEHPHRENPSGPWEAWVVCQTWASSVAIQKKFWELVPKELLDERTAFDEVNGFRTKNPTVRFKNGRIVRFKTTNQGALNLAGATVDYVLIDELTTRRIYTELRKRVMRRGGTVATSATPINAPSGWLQERAEQRRKDGSPILVDLHYRFTADLFVPVGGTEADRFTLGDGTVMDDDWVAEELELTAEEEREVVCHGEWPSGDVERELRGFTSGNVFDSSSALPEFQLYALTFDHGEKAGREVALLCAWDGRCLWVLAEYVSTAMSGLSGDAEAVRDMVGSWGLQLEHVSLAIGDINSGGQLARGMAVNDLLEGEFAALCGGVRPFAIEGAEKAGLDHRIVLLNSGFANARIRVHKDCRILLKAIREWKGQNNRLKDPIDALGYCFQRFASMRPRQRKVRMQRRAA